MVARTSPETVIVLTNSDAEGILTTPRFADCVAALLIVERTVFPLA